MNSNFKNHVSRCLRASCILSILLLQPGGPATGQILGLDSILRTVERENPELKLYDARINAYNSYASGARAFEPPQFGAGFFMTPYNTRMWRPDVMSGSPGMGAFMFSAQQMFSNPQKLKANAAYMQSMSKVDVEMKSAMKSELFKMVKMNYYEWLVLKKKMEVLEESEELLKYMIKSAELRYTYGMDKLNAYYKSVAMLADIQNMRIMLEFEMRQKMLSLNTLMYRERELFFNIDTLYAIRNYESLIIDTLLIRSNRSDFRALNQDMNVLRSKQIYERSKLKPDFGIRYDHMLAFGTQPQQFSLMAMITIPVAPWSSRMYRSSVKALSFEMDALKYRQLVLLNTAAGNLENFRTQIRSKKQQLELYEKTIIPSMQRNYKVTLIAYEQNKEELFMVLDAWQNLKLVQLSYLDILNELLMLQVNFEKELELN